MEALSITSIDILLAAVIIISAGLAFSRGLVHETFAILEWVAAAYVALRFSPVFLPLLRDYISPAWLEYAVVFIGTFLMVLIPLSFLCHRLEETVKRSEVGPVDRALGAIFGVGRGLVIAGIGFIAYAALVPEEQRSPSLIHARSYALIRNTSALLLDLVPGADTSGVRAPRAVAERPARAERREPVKDDTKTYGAGERRALDNLIEATGDGKDRSR